jgi:uncharacterized protein YecE (DUF72 family)
VIKIGCSNFSVAQKVYNSNLSMVELNKFRTAAPRPATVEKWKAQAPAGFEFVVSAVAPDRRSFDRAYHAAKVLGSKTILFHLPVNCGPTSDSVGRLQTFFKMLPRVGLHHVWEAPYHWPHSLVESLSKSLNLIPSTNPLMGKEWTFRTPLKYFRMGRSRKMGGLRPLMDEELRKIKKACGQTPSYVIFDSGPYAFKDAMRFAAIANPKP